LTRRGPSGQAAIVASKTFDKLEAQVERFILITVEAFDWNCSQHIIPRFTLSEIEKLVAPLNPRVAELESPLETCEPVLG
jgi:hypothetical protein